MNTSGIISTAPIGWAPFGLEQVAYQLPGSSRTLDFEQLVAAMAVGRSAQLEREAQVQAMQVRTRNEAIEMLGEVLAEVNRCLETLAQKKDAPDTVANSKLYECKQILVKLGVKSYIVTTNTLGGLNKGNAQKQQAELVYAIDMQDNDLQQDIISMQSLLNKRDDAYATASKLSTRVSDARSQTLENIR